MASACQISECPLHSRSNPTCQHCCSIVAIRTYAACNLVCVKHSLRLTQNEVEVQKLKEALSNIKRVVSEFVVNEKLQREIEAGISSDESGGSSSSSSSSKVEDSFSNWLVCPKRNLPAKDAGHGKRAPGAAAAGERANKGTKMRFFVVVVVVFNLKICAILIYFCLLHQAPLQPAKSSGHGKRARLEPLLQERAQMKAS